MYYCQQKEFVNIVAITETSEGRGLCKQLAKLKHVFHAAFVLILSSRAGYELIKIDVRTIKSKKRLAYFAKRFFTGWISCHLKIRSYTQIVFSGGLTIVWKHNEQLVHQE